MRKLGSCSFCILIRDSDPKDRYIGLLSAPPFVGPPPKCGKHTSLHFFSYMQFSLCAATTFAFSYYLKLFEDAVFGAAGRKSWRMAHIGLRKSWILGLQYHVTEQLPGIVRIMPSSEHPQGFHGNYFRIIINVLQEHIHYCMAPWYLPAASNPFGK